MVIIHYCLDIFLQGGGGKYADDVIITGNCKNEAKHQEDHLIKHFEVINLGPLKCFLGIEVAQSSRGLLIN